MHDPFGQIPLYVPCRFCGAPFGRECRTPSGRVARDHHIGRTQVGLVIELTRTRRLRLGMAETMRLGSRHRPDELPASVRFAIARLGEAVADLARHEDALIDKARRSAGAC